MTTDCIDHVHFAAPERHLRDAVLGVVIAVVFIIPATLSVFVLLG